MKKVVLLFSFLFVSTVGFGQWEQAGNTIVDQNINNVIGYSLATNNTGDRITVLRIAENFVKDVTVYEFQQGTWTQLGNTVIIYVGNNSNASVSMNGDGSRFVAGIGPSNEFGVAKVYELENGVWSQLGGNIVGDSEGDEFAGRVAINKEGNTIIAGTGNPAQGYVKVYEFVNEEWIQKGSTIQDVVSGEQMGLSVAINATGDVIAASSPSSDESFPNAGKVSIFEFENDDWTFKGTPILGTKAQDKIGLANTPGNSALKLNDTGDIIAYGTWAHTDNNSEQVGLVEVYEFLNGSWELKGNRFEGTSDNYSLGGSIDLNADGNIIAMSDFQSFGGEQVLLFNYENGAWQQIDETITPPDLTDPAFFGFSIVLNDDGNTIIVGDPDDGHGGVSEVWAYQNSTVLDTYKPSTSQFKLYPNPNKGLFDISFPENQDRVTISIVDLLGRQVVAIDYFNTSKIAVHENLKSGIYLVDISAKGVSETVRIIVE